MARVGFIGTGQIATAMVRGLAGCGHEIFVSDRNARIASSLAAEVEGVTVASNAGVVERADIIFLCLREEVVDEVLPSLPFTGSQSVISVMVGVRLARLRRLCSATTDVAITIPLPGIARGGCPLPVYPASPTLELLFGHLNPVFPVDSEVALNAHFGASAVSSPLLAMMAETATWLAEFTGDPLLAEAYVVKLIRSYLPENARPDVLADALKVLSTEGGLNASLRDRMNAASSDLREGLDAIAARLDLKIL